MNANRMMVCGMIDGELHKVAIIYGTGSDEDFEPVLGVLFYPALAQVKAQDQAASAGADTGDGSPA